MTRMSIWWRWPLRTTVHKCLNLSRCPEGISRAILLATSRSSLLSWCPKCSSMSKTKAWTRRSSCRRTLNKHLNYHQPNLTSTEVPFSWPHLKRKKMRFLTVTWGCLRWLTSLTTTPAACLTWALSTSASTSYNSSSSLPPDLPTSSESAPDI